MVIWATYQYSREPKWLILDEVVYDLETKEVRRVTTRPYAWGVVMHEPKLPWSYWGEFTDLTHRLRAHAINLEKFGIMDEQGPVIPGEAGLDPPE